MLSTPDLDTHIGALADGNTPLKSFRRDLDEQLVGLAVRFPGDPRHAARQ